MFLKFLKEVLFPLFCINCDREGSILCDTCLRSADAKGICACPVCGLKNENGMCCELCKENSFVEQVYAAGSYKEGILDNLIHALKYQYVEGANEYIEKIIQPFVLLHKNELETCDAIIPIPLHARRFAERGFNQSQMIADILSRELGKPVVQPLKRFRYTKQQMKLTKEERSKNMKDVFICKKKVEYKQVLLVDDVYTTGATMQAAAQALKAKYSEILVYGFVVARG